MKPTQCAQRILNWILEKVSLFGRRSSYVQDFKNIRHKRCLGRGFSCVLKNSLGILSIRSSLWWNRRSVHSEYSTEYWRKSHYSPVGARRCGISTSSSGVPKTHFLDQFFSQIIFKYISAELKDPSKLIWELFMKTGRPNGGTKIICPLCMLSNMRGTSNQLAL